VQELKERRQRGERNLMILDDETVPRRCDVGNDSK